MSRRKCCCDCTDDTCRARRDSPIGRYDDLILEIPVGLDDETYCTEGSNTCEDIVTGDHTMTGTGFSDDWDNGSPLIHNCHCVGATDIEFLATILQECEDISDAQDGSALVCMVTVTLQLLETTGCTPPSGGADQTWVYKVMGPIDVRAGQPDFEVPFFSETLGTPAVSVCVDGQYPPFVIIKEVP